MQEKIIVKRTPDSGSGFGWTVTAIRASGPHKGKEHCLAILCGGNVGKVLAALCAKQVAQMMMIDTIEVEPDLASTEGY